METMELDFMKQGGLVPVIVQDANTRKVLMLGYMNETALQQTMSTKRVTFYSRTRNCIWVKGETSGNYLELVSLKVDCDNDTLLVQVNPKGPVCHKGTDTCWGEENTASPLLFLKSLQDIIEQRKREMPKGSYTTSLFNDGINRIAQKVGEESLEAMIEAVNGTTNRLIYECSDLIYHLCVLLTQKGLRIEDVAEELAQRHLPGWKKHN